MASGTRRIILILLIAATVYLVGNARMALWDRDEPRYAQCSRQMLQSGDWVVPRLYDKLRFQKPPLIYWCQALAMKLLGSETDAGAFAARLPSTLAMLATLTLVAIAVSRESGTQQAMWTVFVLSSSVMTILAAKMCVTDSVLLFFVTGGQLCVFALWRGSRSWLVVVALAVMVALAVLTKVVIIFGVILSTLAVLGVMSWFDRWRARTTADATVSQAVAVPSPPYSGERVRVRGLSESSAIHEIGPSPQPSSLGTGERENGVRTAAQWIVGALIVAAIAGPWFWLVRHRAPDFLPMMLHEGRQHALEGKEGHHFWPGYHLVVVWPMFMPWSLLLPLAIGVAIAQRKTPEVRFALAAIIGPWLVFEFTGTKLPHYLLPVYPPMAFLVARVIRRCLAGERRELQSVGFGVGLGIWSAAVLAIGIAPWLAAIRYSPLPWTAACLTLFALLYVGLVVRSFRRDQFSHAFTVMGTGMLAAMLLLCGLYFPTASFLRTSVPVADILRREGATRPGDVVMVDYKEPSLAFYQGGTIREVDRKEDLLRLPLERWPAWIVLTREVWNLIPAKERQSLRIVGSARGCAYADRARAVEVLVIHKEPIREVR